MALQKLWWSYVYHSFRRQLSFFLFHQHLTYLLAIMATATNANGKRPGEQADQTPAKQLKSVLTLLDFTWTFTNIGKLGPITPASSKSTRVKIWCPSLSIWTASWPAQTSSKPLAQSNGAGLK